ncbi:LpxB [Desulfamplus magnetovallimortis]|uniref:Lipid-A-disaccharide synthase n=1 Tax=Desulfamplus magnetovallimortis TaxID=1246637 RepID=A0A1W1H509_9BACT|nr:lipid-A-disaccharide synthase [Desulfamplus magnetovallimortis]SLM27465.1 LpxB [Desulfamplus magnetovallimortis]
MKKYKIMIIAGEPSGDLHGSSLVKALFRTANSDLSLKITGIGGDLMAANGMELFYHINNLSVMGVTEVLLQWKKVKRAFELFRHNLKTDIPDLVILIDYPGFNLKAAAFVRKFSISLNQSIPVLYYVTPKVWAWNRSRLAKIRENVDHAALIFPFEEQIYRKAGIPSTFVGNPLIDYYEQVVADICSQSDLNANNGLAKTFTIGLLPGSRAAEISSLLELMLESARLIQMHCTSINFIVSLSPAIEKTEKHLLMFNKILEEYSKSINIRVVKGVSQKFFARCDLLVAASGTVTLEAAIWGVPMIIVYKVSALTAFLARRLLIVSHVGLPNIVAGYEVVPEFIQEAATPEAISYKAISMVNAPSELNEIRRHLGMLRRRLGGPGASIRTARIAMHMLRCNP